MRIPSNHRLERILTLIASALSLLLGLGFWLALRLQQPVWPFPALYLLEMAVVSILITVGLWQAVTGSPALRSRLPWVGIGLILGFVVLGAFSIGFAYLPVALLFAAAASLSDRRMGRNVLVHLGVAFIAALAQVAVMLLVIQLL
jgi:hypothetical protein